MMQSSDLSVSPATTSPIEGKGDPPSLGPEDLAPGEIQSRV